MNKITTSSELSSDKKKSEENKACYRGFTSIDQEMEREIAMQWFSTTVRTTTNFHGFRLVSRK